ncbi:MAG: hypothetical protein REI09_15285, partial [Candidatus Dactylopiibacterium sp.]|nr:hypothetical protein [Candidatus Dactylopiibacterium sp.]
ATASAPGAAPAQPRSAPVFHAEPDYLDQAVRLRALPASELGARGEQLARAYATRRNEANRLQLALFLAVAPAPAGDRGRALALLDLPPGESNGRGRTHPLAQLLLPLLHDVRRLDDSHAASQQKLRELQQAYDDMRQKIEALREIELRLQERPKTP